jgi:hypothetical protein
VNAKRIFIISDFKDDSPKSVRVERRRWIKGLLRLGHDVQRFSFRDMIEHRTKFPGKIAKKYFGRPKAFAILIEQIMLYQPDIVLNSSLKDFDLNDVKQMREVARNAKFVGRDCDPYPENYPERIESAKGMDIVVATNAGKFLQTYKDAGAPICAFIPCPCDPDIQRRYENLDEKWKHDIIFTGTEEHRRHDRNMERYNLLNKLSTMSNVKLYGCFGYPAVDGIDTFYAISGAKIALSINIANDVRMYHSDRLVNCLSCGTFTLAKRVPDTDLLFKEGVHLRYFDTAEEFLELADWYLKHDDERKKISQAGMEHAHKEFNCTKMAGYLINIIETGKCSAIWNHVI